MRLGFIALILAVVVVAGMKVFGGAAADHQGADTASAAALAEAATSLPLPRLQRSPSAGRGCSTHPERPHGCATVSRSALVLAAPHAGSDPIATLDQQTEEGTTNVVLVVAHATTNEGHGCTSNCPCCRTGERGGCVGAPLAAIASSTLAWSSTAPS